MVSRLVLLALAAAQAACLSSPGRGERELDAAPDTTEGDGGGGDGGEGDAGACVTILHDEFDADDPALWESYLQGGGTREVGEGGVTLTAAPPEDELAFAGMWSREDYEPRGTSAVMKVGVDRTAGGEFFFEIKTNLGEGVGMLMTSNTLQAYYHAGEDADGQVLCDPCPFIDTTVELWLAIAPATAGTALQYSSDGETWQDLIVGPALSDPSAYYTGVQAESPHSAIAKLDTADWSACPFEVE